MFFSQFARGVFRFVIKREGQSDVGFPPPNVALQHGFRLPAAHAPIESLVGL
jgi:hypothetical protein